MFRFLAICSLLVLLAGCAQSEIIQSTFVEEALTVPIPIPEVTVTILPWKPR